MHESLVKLSNFSIDFYKNNRITIDSVFSTIFLLATLNGTIDLSFMQTLISLGTLYMCTFSFGIIYNSIPETFELTNSSTFKKICDEIQLLGNGMFTCFSLLVTICAVDVLSYTLYFRLLQIIFRGLKLALYAYFSKKFVEILTIYCNRADFVEVRNIHLKIPTYTKHLINVVAINRVICHAICGTLNLNVLTLFNSLCTNGYYTITMLSSQYPKMKDQVYKFRSKRSKPENIDVDNKINEASNLKKFV